MKLAAVFSPQCAQSDVPCVVKFTSSGVTFLIPDRNPEPPTGVAVAVGVNVFVAVAVGVYVFVAVAVAVNVFVAVADGVNVFVAVAVGVSVAVEVATPQTSVVTVNSHPPLMLPTSPPRSSTT